MTAASREDRALFRDSARSFLTDCATSADVRRWMRTDRGWDPDLWTRVAGELGWQGVPLPEEFGGLGLGWAETALLMEEMGASLFCSPFFATICLAATAIRLGRATALKERYLPGIASGEMTAALAAGEAGSNAPFDAITLVATPVDGGFVLDGDVGHVIDGHTADVIVVAARLPGRIGADGVALLAVAGDSADLERSAAATLDQTRRLARLRFTGVRVATEAALGAPGDDWTLLERTLDVAGVMLAAEQAGGARRCLELTTDYIKERVQFGRAIGSFQAIKHRCAHMMVKVESALAAALAAAEAADADDPQFPLLASMAKAYCSEAYFACAGEAIQLHGGVGFTWEYDPQLYFKRARASAAMLGTPQYHRERIAEGLGL